MLKVSFPKYVDYLIKREGKNYKEKLVYYKWNKDKYIPEFAFLWESAGKIQQDKVIGEVDIDGVKLPLEYSKMRSRGISDV